MGSDWARRSRPGATFPAHPRGAGAGASGGKRAWAAAAALATALVLPAGGGAARADTASPVALAHGGLGTLSGAYLAARFAGSANDLPSAAAFYGSALRADPENPLLLDRTVLLKVASGAVDEGATLAERLVEIDPDNQVALVTLAVDHMVEGDLARARAAIGTFDTGGPLQELSAGLMKAWVTTAEGDPERAIEQLTALEGPSWYAAFTELHAGLIADHAGLCEVAVEHLGEAYAADPTALRVIDAYARALARAGEGERALNLLQDFGLLHGDDTYTAPLVKALLDGEEVGPQIRSANEGTAEALFGLGTAVGREGGEMFAAGYLQLARHLAPDNPFISTSLASLMERMEQHEAAIAVYDDIPETSLLHRKATIQTALNLNVLDREDEAIARLTPLVEADPTDLEAVIALGNIMRSRRRFDEAAEIYSLAIDAVDIPDAYWSIYYYRGIAYEQTDRWPLAEADFQRALEMYPDQPLVLNYLGYSWIDRGENLDVAIEMVRKAVEQRPEDGYIVDSLGWAYYRLGEYEKAVEHLERAVSLRPEDPVINDHLGDAYWKVGRRLEAMFQWSHACDLDPEPEELEKILAKLENGLPDEDGPRERERAAVEELAE